METNVLRRTFIALAGAALLAFPAIGHAADGFVDYRPGVLKAAFDDGKKVLVDYFAPW